jgi:hypothetical protein
MTVLVLEGHDLHPGEQEVLKNIRDLATLAQRSAQLTPEEICDSAKRTGSRR